MYGTRKGDKKENGRKRINDEYIDEVHISVDGATESVNDEIRGEGSYRKAIESANYMSEKGVSVRISTTITKSNIDDIENNLEVLLGNISEDIHIDLGKAIDQGRCESKDLVQPYNLKDSSDNLYNRLEERGLKKDEKWEKRRNKRKRNCLYAGLVIKPNGDLYSCPRVPDYFRESNIRDENLEDILERWDDKFEMSEFHQFSTGGLCWRLNSEHAQEENYKNIPRVSDPWFLTKLQ